jgi:hypothetical protein
MIKFKFKPEKMASAIAYMVQRHPGLTKKQISKLLYFADKEHLLRYGRTITATTIRLCRRVMCPARSNMMNRRCEWVPESAVACLIR